MRVIAYSHSRAVCKEVAQVPSIEGRIVATEQEMVALIEAAPQVTVIVLCHLDSYGAGAAEWCQALMNDYPSAKVIALRDRPDFTEGCWLIRQGVRGYGHSLSNHHIIAQIVQTVGQGSVWIYPELMQFIIAKLPSNPQWSVNQILSHLTPQEQKIALLVAEGMSNAKIGEVLAIAESTVKKHIGSIFTKLNINDRLTLALIIKKT
ncbi:response regulator transcription factor [Chrysiogenes arsenatis]|uniref:response regulator transcription factor n=1 Tax=Chrysiogenes arsenatis TaxID=309797 RepID=UPI0003F91EFF|nr:response regulator transcription factor [Chrysiogenes arsenatis]